MSVLIVIARASFMVSRNVSRFMSVHHKTCNYLAIQPDAATIT